MEWFIDIPERYGLSKTMLVEEILTRKNVLLESYYVANEIEGEVFVRIKQLRTPIETYIDAQVLPNTILIRLVKVLEAVNNEKTLEIVYLGELGVPGIVPHHHEHGYFDKNVEIEWFNDMLKRLSVSVEEKNSYIEKVRKNLERIVKAYEHARELNSEILVTIEGESEEVFGAFITRIVGIYAESLGNLYICFIEEHARGNTVTHYFFRMGKIIIK